MKRLRRTFLLLVAVAMLIGMARFGLTVWQCETGWDTLSVSWKDATIGWFGWRHKELAYLDPTDQADFWLAEIERIEQSQPESAELCAVAAILLDSPSPQYSLPYMHTAIGLNSAESYALEQRFEAKCRSRCLALAARATELDPDNVCWWRVRACLLFEDLGVCSWYGESREIIRCENWLDVLDECSRHDPDNALYDYLAAVVLFHESAELRYGPDSTVSQSRSELADDISEELQLLLAFPHRVIIDDAEQFQQGVARCRRARNKPYLAVGDAALPAMGRFFDRTDIPRRELLDVVEYPRFLDQWGLTIFALHRFQKAQVDEARRSNNPEQAVDELRHFFRIYDQSNASNDKRVWDDTIWFDYSYNVTCQTLFEISEKHPGLIDPKELARARAQNEEIQLKDYVNRKAVHKRNSVGWRHGHWNTYRSLCLTSLETPIVVLGVIAFFGLGLGSWLARPEDRDTSTNGTRMGILHHLAAWILGFALSFVLFGMVPGKCFVDDEIQETIFVVILGWVLPSMLVLRWVVWPLLLAWKRRRFQYSMRAMFLSITVVAGLFAFGPGLLRSYSNLAAKSADLCPSTKGWDPIHTAALQGNLSVGDSARAIYAYGSNSGWLRALMQWLLYHGTLIASAIALVLVALLFARRCSKADGEPFFHYWTRLRRTRYLGLFRCVGRSALVAAACCLLVWTWTTPWILRDVETSFQRNILLYRNPDKYREEIETVRAEIRADEQEMALFRKETLQKYRLP